MGQLLNFSSLQVRREGKRQVERMVRHYNLDAILAVGYRVRSERGMQFRQWATERLKEYLVKGFTMDDERLKNPKLLVKASFPLRWLRWRCRDRSGFSALSARCLRVRV